MTKKRTSKGKGKTKKTKKTTEKTGKKLAGSIYQRSRERAEQALSEMSGSFWKPQDGRNVVRLFTFVDDDGMEQLWAREVRHWQVDTDNPNVSVNCPGRETCPICKVLDELAKPVAEKVRPQKKDLCNCVVRSADGEDQQKIAQMPVSVSKQLDQLVGDPENFGCLDLKKGRDFIITRTGKGFQTKYNVMPMAKEKPIGVEVEPVNLAKRIRETDMETLENIASLLEGRKS